MAPAVAENLVELVLSALLGGVFTFAWSSLAYGNRLTRLETKVEAFEKSLEGLEEGIRQVAGRRAWHIGGPSNDR